MLNPQVTRNILHKVNLQINSNLHKIRPTPSTFDIPSKLALHSQTKQSIKQLDKSYPKQKLTTNTNLISAFAILYTRFRQAIKDNDEPMMHRYLTNALYQQWKQKGNTGFNVYPTVHDIRLRQAQVCGNQYGKWVQCLVGWKHGGVYKEHIVERKLQMMPDAARTWYFIHFQN